MTALSVVVRRMGVPLSSSAFSEALVHVWKGQAYTTSLVIAREFGRPHKNVLRSIDSLIADGTINRLNFEPTTYADECGRAQRMIVLSERAALIAMPFIGGSMSRQGQAHLVDAFMRLRAELPEQNGRGWVDRRKSAALGQQMMAAALKDVRAQAGKATLPHHYVNEAKLVNFVVFGRWDAVCRDELSQSELAMIEAVEVRNAVWIAQGKAYADRKKDLKVYALLLGAADESRLQ